jgi:hypothetical protein
MVSRLPKFRTLTAAGIAAALCVVTSAALPQVAPFAGMAGNWSGTGHIDMQNGSSERIRCRATYRVGDGGNSFHQELRCASDSYKFDVTSDVQARGSSISGTWSEASRGVTGSVSGTVSGGRIQARVEGGAFSATLTVTTNGRSQGVTIVPVGTDVKGVTVGLAKV